MKIVDFIEQYNNATDKQKFIKKIIYRHYIPYAEKMSAANNIVRLSTYDETGSFRVNSPLRYLLWVQAVLQCYTTLELGDRFVDAYDVLDQAGIIEGIISAVGRDAESLQTIISMTFDDLLTNERDIVPYIDGKLIAIMEALSSISLPDEIDGSSENVAKE